MMAMPYFSASAGVVIDTALPSTSIAPESGA
jgi:hypothetical protein